MLSRIFLIGRSSLFSKWSKQFSTDLLRTDTKTVKDVILFKNESPKYFKYMNFFAFSQYFFWCYLAHFTYTSLRDAPVKAEESSNLPWYARINLGENKYRNGITIFCITVAHLTLLSAWSYTLRSVRFLVLRKGGQTVSFVTYTPFGTNRIMDVPIKYVSASESRENARVHLPIKVKGTFLYYMLDMTGSFPNKSLFDATAGMYRKF